MIFGIAFGLPVAYLIVRTRVWGKDALDFVITLMLAFPGIAIGVSYLLAFWKDIPLARYWIIMPLALFARRLPYFLRMAHSSYLQLDPSLEEASEVSGAGKIRTFFSISLPLLLKGVLVGVVMFFIMAFQEISTAVFLYKGGWETLPIGIYLNWHRGMEFGIAAAMAFLMIVITFYFIADYIKNRWRRPQSRLGCWRKIKVPGFSARVEGLRLQVLTWYIESVNDCVRRQI